MVYGVASLPDKPLYTLVKLINHFSKKQLINQCAQTRDRIAIEIYQPVNEQHVYAKLDLRIGQLPAHQTQNRIS
jgi:hypothetical protein